MSLADRFKSWRNRRARRRVLRSSDGPLREFVYLDDVSLYSLLASRKDGIATEFTESETASLNGEVSGSVGAGVGGSRAESRARFEAGQSRTTQVVRKAIVQSSFKELRNLELERLAMPTPMGLPPRCESLEHLQRLDTGNQQGWIVDPECLQRGDLVEVEVALEADHIFRASTAITTVREIMQENLQLFGADNLEQLAEMRAVGRMLESLLVGLVPVRGRLTRYETLVVAGKERLVHRDLVEQLSPSERATACPTFIVGVAERDLFWKDIRRILFSQSTFTVFGRLSAGGTSDTWRPVKLLDVLGEIHPMFGEEISDLGETALLAMEAAVDASQQPTTDRLAGLGIASSFLALLAEHHGVEMPDETLESCLRSASPSDPGWITAVDSRRTVLRQLQEAFDSSFGVVTPRETASNLRIASVLEAGLTLDGSVSVVTAPSAQVQVPAVVPRHERFLDTELVAVYW